jgi:hypothetical protein
VIAASVLVTAVRGLLGTTELVSKPVCLARSPCGDSGGPARCIRRLREGPTYSTLGERLTVGETVDRCIAFSARKCGDSTELVAEGDRSVFGIIPISDAPLD